MSRARRVTRWGAVGGALALIAVAGPARAIAPVPDLVATPSPVTAGEQVSFTGRGFVVPPIEGCEVLSAAVAVDPQCSLDGHAYGSFVLADDVIPGSYDVTVCAPSCAVPWAGVAHGRLTVDEPATRGVAIGPAVLVDDGVEVTPSAAAPGDQVFVEAVSVPTLSRTCAAEWVGEAVTTATCTLDDQGVVTGVLAAPDVDVTGERTLVVCWPTCADAVGGSARTLVPVLARPVPTPTEAPTPTPAPTLAPTPPISASELVATDQSSDSTTPALLGAAVLALLALAAGVARWALRRPPVLPALRPVPDLEPSLVTRLSQPSSALPALRIRGVPDAAPAIVLEVQR